MGIIIRITTAGRSSLLAMSSSVDEDLPLITRGVTTANARRQGRWGEHGFFQPGSNSTSSSLFTHGCRRSHAGTGSHLAHPAAAREGKRAIITLTSPWLASSKHPAKNCPLWSLPLSHNPPHHPQTQSATKSRARCPNQIRVASWSACSLCLELAHRASCIVRSLWGIKSLRRGTARCTSKGDSCGSSSGLRVLGLRVDEDRLRV